MNQRDDLLVWMDLEMTSLVDVTIDSIIEIALVVTDKNLHIVAEGPDIVIHADRERFDHIPPDVRAIHEKSGIIPEVIASTVTEAQAQHQVLDFLKEYVIQHTSPLCGNSIHMDRMFLIRRMPELHTFLFYRNIDVSTMKELARRWRPELYEEMQALKSPKAHRAMDDIHESIEELKFYRKHWLE